MLFKSYRERLLINIAVQCPEGTEEPEFEEVENEN